MTVDVIQKKQREFALQVVRDLQQAGYEALWAGGCVRDELLGLPPKDFDIATSAKPDEVRQLFGHRRTLAVGAAFGVIVVLGPRGAGQIDVATFREDAEYSDRRRPDHVTYTTAEHDAQRRDFTINGLFFNPVNQQIIDYVDGQRDLQRRVVRAIGDPRERLAEDRLRMLRAVRFAATFDFDLDDATLAAVQEMADDVLSVSGERIGQEIRRMLLHPSRSIAIEWLRRSNLLPVVLPELAGLITGADPAKGQDPSGGVDRTPWQTLTRVLATLHEPTFPLALAALLVQTNRPGQVDALRERFKLSNKESTRLAWLLAHFAQIGRAADLPWPELQRLLICDGIDELLTLREAMTSSTDASLVYCREKLAMPVERLNPPPLLTGDDLIAHGVPAGKHFQYLLTRVRDAQLDEEIRTQAEALALVDQLRSEGS